MSVARTRDDGLVAGLDIGGSKVHAVVVDPARPAAVLGQHRVPTRGGGEGVVATAVEALEVAAAGAGTTVGALAGVGVGVPGLVDPRAGGVAHAVNLGLGADGLGLRSALALATGAPVVVENDVNAAALGAAALLRGARGARWRADLAYLSVGTGLAAGLVLDGRLRRGAVGAAGEIGHVPVDPGGPACPCGQRGCLETVASGGAVARAWPSVGVPAARAVLDAADAGDARALALCARLCSGLALAVRMLVCTVDVEVVVLGGGVAELGERLAEKVREHLEHVAQGSPFLAALDLPARLVTTAPGVPVAAIGAALAGHPALAAATRGTDVAAPPVVPVASEGQPPRLTVAGGV